MLHSSPDKMWTITITSLRIHSNREPSSTVNEGLRMETFGWFFSKGIPLRGLISRFPSKYVFLNVHPWQKPFQTLEAKKLSYYFSDFGLCCPQPVLLTKGLRMETFGWFFFKVYPFGVQYQHFHPNTFFWTCIPGKNHFRPFLLFLLRLSPKDMILDHGFWGCNATCEVPPQYLGGCILGFHWEICNWQFCSWKTRNWKACNWKNRNWKTWNWTPCVMLVFAFGFPTSTENPVAEKPVTGKSIIEELVTEKPVTHLELKNL